MATPQQQTPQPQRAPAPPPAIAQTKPVPSWSAIDPTALVNHVNPRKHEIQDPDGRIHTYEFWYAKKTQMPFEHAMKFLKAGFQVFDPRNKRQTVQKTVNEATSAVVELLPNQCIADLAELTSIALARRANKIKGGEQLTAQTDKGTIIDFLMDNAPGWIAQETKAPAATAEGDDAGEADLVDKD